MKKQKFTEVWLTYWSKNMAFIERAKLQWFGFSYTADEKQQMTQLANQVSGKEFATFLTINTILFMGIAALFIVFGMFPILEAIYPTKQEMQNVSPVFFFSLLGFICVLMISIGLPLAMTLSALLVNSFFKKSITPLPDTQSNRLYRKIMWQFFRIGIILTVISMALAFWDIRLGGKISKVIGPMVRILGPLTSIATLLYLFVYRKNKNENKTA